MGVEPALYPRLVLFQRPEVQTELKLTPTQKARWAELDQERQQASERQGQELRKSRQELGNPPDPQALAVLNESLRAIQADRQKQDEAILRKVLDRPQFTRLGEIQLQAEGPMAFTRHEIQERLNLGPDQVELIEEVVARGREAVRNAAVVSTEVVPTRLTREKSRALLESKTSKSAIGKARDDAVKARKTTMQEIAKLLTKGQRAKYEAMVGEPFDFLKMQANAESRTLESKPEAKSP
jgi:hypothetical protein